MRRNFISNRDEDILYWLVLAICNSTFIWDKRKSLYDRHSHHLWINVLNKTTVLFQTTQLIRNCVNNNIKNLFLTPQRDIYTPIDKFIVDIRNQSRYYMTYAYIDKCKKYCSRYGSLALVCRLSQAVKPLSFVYNWIRHKSHQCFLYQTTLLRLFWRLF